jgi:hypothetical protein
MHALIKGLAAFGLVAVLAGPALAQGRGGYGGGGGGLMLIANPSVQKELKLDETQVEKAREFSEAQRAKRQELNSQLEGLEGEERFKKMQELNKANTDEGMKTIAGMLKPEQVKRFKQIELQQRGANALTDPEVVKALGITAEQTEKFQALMADSRTKMQEAFQNAGDDRQAAMAKNVEIRKETNTKGMALLTDDQKKAWKELTGEPFEVVQQPRNR